MKRINETKVEGKEIEEMVGLGRKHITNKLRNIKIFDF